MIISHKYKFVFLHVKKAAGTAITKALEPHLGPADVCTGSVRDNIKRSNCPPNLKGHATYLKINSMFPQWDLSKYKWWCVERNSYQKALEDWWFHYDIAKDYEKGFASFVRDTENISDWRIYYGEGKFQAEVIDYDHLYDVWPHIIQELGLPVIDLSAIRLKVPDTSRMPTCREAYSDGVRKMVEQKFANEIEAFQYEFPTAV